MTISIEDLGRAVAALSERIAGGAVSCDVEGCDRTATDVEPRELLSEDPERWGPYFLCGRHAEEVARLDVAGYASEHLEDLKRLSAEVQPYCAERGLVTLDALILQRRRDLESLGSS